MNREELRLIGCMFITFYSIVALIILAVAILEPKKMNEDSTEAQVVKGDFCFSELIQSGDSISESEPGIYNYEMYVTSKGIEVWVPCE